MTPDRPRPWVELRPWSADDAADLVRLFDDELVYRFTPIAEPFNLEAAERRIRLGARGEAEARLRFRAIVVDGQPAGEVAAYRRGDTDDFGISYVVGSAFRGRHVAREAVARMIDELRERWQAKRFIAEIATNNHASQVVAGELGFAATPDAIPERRSGKNYFVVPWILTP